MASGEDDWRKKQPIQKPPTINRNPGVRPQEQPTNSVNDDEDDDVVVPLRPGDESHGQHAAPTPPPGAPSAQSGQTSEARGEGKSKPPPLEDYGSGPLKRPGGGGGGGEGVDEAASDESQLPKDARDGCYILSVGRVGSGKSTLQMHLLRYLIQGGENAVKVDPKFAGGNRAFQKILRQWQECWRRGLFPEATVMGRPKEFIYRVKPHLENRPELKFGFVEMSGEDFRELTRAADDGRKPRFTNGLDDFLTSGASIIFLFVVNGHNIADDDSLFWYFLQHLEDLEHATGGEFKRNCAACLVIADPENAQLRLANRLQEQYDATVPLDAEGFARMFVPSTVEKLREWDDKKRGLILPFSVGVVEERTFNDEVVRVIVEPNFDAARTLYRWLYRRFTGASPGRNDPTRPFRTFLKRLERLVERMNSFERGQ